MCSLTIQIIEFNFYFLIGVLFIRSTKILKKRAKNNNYDYLNIKLFYETKEVSPLPSITAESTDRLIKAHFTCL